MWRRVATWSTMALMRVTLRVPSERVSTLLPIFTAMRRYVACSSIAKQFKFCVQNYKKYGLSVAISHKEAQLRVLSEKK